MAPGLGSDRNNEDWMKTLPEELWDIPLTNLAIPGGKTDNLTLFTIFFLIGKVSCRVCTSQRANIGKQNSKMLILFSLQSTAYLSNMANAFTYRSSCYATSVRPPYWKGPDSTVGQYKSML